MKKKKWLSIFLVVCLIGGIGGGIWYRQKRIDERRLSLVYIPKVVESTDPGNQNGSTGVQCSNRDQGTDRRK